MERRWYAPNEAWPRHSKPWWEDALQEAKEAGWHCMPLSGHAWGRIACDPSLPDACKFVIFSTGRSGESAAQEASKLIRRCRHVSASVADGLLREADRCLVSADVLLDAAARCLEAHDLRDRVEELLRLASWSTDEAEKLLERAIASDAGAESAIGDAYRAGLRESPGLAYPPDPADLLGEADQRIVAAEDCLTGAPASPRKGSLQERAAEARVKLADLSGRAGLGNADG